MVMKKGDKRIRVDILDKETKVKLGEKDIYELNRFGGSGAFNMSWQDRNKMPRPNSKRQQKLLKEKIEKFEQSVNENINRNNDIQ